jgi:hypothetical protein
MNSGFKDSQKTYTASVAGVNDLFNRTIGNMGVFRNQRQIF